MKIITKILIVLCMVMAIALMAPSYDTEAKTVNRYATKTVALYKTKGGKVAKRVRYNTRLKLVRQWKVWARVKYKGNTYAVRKKYLSRMKAVKKYSGRYFRRAGRINWKGYAYTWYSQRVLPGTGLKIPGRHLDSQGFVCDKDGYIVVGSCVANKNKRVIVPTPFGKYGKCYDCGYVGSNHFDCYVAW